MSRQRLTVYQKIAHHRHESEEKLYELLYDFFIKQNKVTCVGLILKQAAEFFPADIALICGDKEVTFRQLYYHATQLSLLLSQRGIKAHDRVLLLMENSIAFYIAYFGILQIGAVVVPLNTFLHEKELAHIIGDAKPAFFICSSARIEKIREISIELPPIIDESVFNVDTPVPDAFDEYNVEVVPFDAMVALLYTSGTTGFPKGVMLSSRNILTNVLQVIARFTIIEQQRIFAVLPLFHSFAQNICVWISILMGCTVIIVPKIDRRALLAGLEHKPTIFLGVPALYGVLCLLKTAPLDSISHFVSGGDALPDKIRSFFSLVYRRKICSGYGTTEASPVVSADLEDITEITNCTGRPLVGVGCSIRDDNFTEVSPGQIGQLWLKGPTVMLGYYNCPEMNEQVFREGWFATGDLAYFDPHGKLVITGRVKDLIINKGIKIYPQEVENVILLSPDVLVVGVVGQDDPDVGQFPVAYVTVRSMSTDIEQSLKNLCMQHLAPYKIPRQFICSTEQLATTATGKVDKKILRKRLAQK